MAAANPISFRLDDESAEALSVLQRESGLDQSGAVRLALIEAAQRRRRASLAAEAEALAADPADRAEVAEIRALMDSLRATG
jgi:antitoxin component of RelBE/YafQ-DinJ toxin-antitoxin module